MYSLVVKLLENFNKFLKNNPETMRSWIRILQEVPGSILCLLENPSTGTNYMRRFVHEATGTPSVYENERGEQFSTFEPNRHTLGHHVFFSEIFELIN